MEISLDELLAGKSTVIKNKEYFPTEQYITPFLNKMSKYTSKFLIQAQAADQMSITKASKDTVWNRIWVQAVLPESNRVDNHDEVYGLIYGLDVKKPVVKMYRGGLNLACMNLTIFNPSWLNTQELLDEPINFNPLQELAEKENDMRLVLNKLKSEYMDREKHTDYLGQWVDFCIREGDDLGFGATKIATSTPISAYKKVFLDSESDYYVPEGIDPTKFQIYNAFTELITHSIDIIKVADKTLLLGRLLNVSSN